MPFMPTHTKFVVNGRVMGGTMLRKVAKRTKPWLLPAVAEAGAAAGNPALLPPQPPEDEEWVQPPAKRSKLQPPSSSIPTAAEDGVAQEHHTSRAEENVVTKDDIPEDIPTYPVTPAAASLVSAAASRAPRQSWTLEEHTKLTEAVKKHGKIWVAVATMVPGRTGKQCRNRWTQCLDSAGKTGGQWNGEENTKLTEAVKKHGKKWVAVAAMIPGRTDQQCRNRWTQSLDSAGKTAGQWKPGEDAKLLDAVKKHGKKWVAVAEMVPGRTDKQCRNRWTQTLDSAGHTAGLWKPGEDAKLLDAVKKHGKKWVAVAEMVPGRTDEQCRSRWTHKLDPSNGKRVGKILAAGNPTKMQSWRKRQTNMATTGSQLLCWFPVELVASVVNDGSTL
jgi:S-ribosylhomocysteine lyase LuxS involved in autoinducer biosynthesis